jgi:hypothetical protein
MNRKTIFLTIACLTFAVGLTLASVWFYQKHFISFEMVSVGDGFVKEGGGAYWLQEWRSSDGVTIYELMRGYPSEQDARAAFEEELKKAASVIERESKPAGSAVVDERAVGTFADPRFNEPATSIIRLQKKDVYRVDAPSPKYALAFERYRGRE